ncbi:MAG: hypothetical protein KAR40_05700 [Candidatus Sabulitectum sp.]|nr:hypothetical protein [Candidatus Sabulitectum sp.]
MRVPRIKRSSLKYPLDDILGSPALVRLIRVLVYEIAGSVGVADAARMAGLSQAGARKALVHLSNLGIAERTGTGRALKFSPKKDHPFLHLFGLLFKKEHEHYESLIFMLQQTFAIPEVLSAWVTELPLEIGQALQLEVVTESRAIGWIREELRTRLIEAEKMYDLIIELTVFTRADEPEAPKGAIVLCGMGNTTYRNHLVGESTQQDSEQRSLKLAKAIADLIKKDPSLIKRTCQYTNRLLYQDQGMANRDIAEWRQLLETYSIDRIRDLLVSTSSRAIRLRRSLPFLAVLTHHERDRILAEMEKPSDEI